MTFACHGAAGFTMGWVLGSGLSDPWQWSIAILFAIIAMFPDVGSWVFWKLWPEKWQRWELYNLCHPPYQLSPKSGTIDYYMKWFPPWGFHTWVIDSIIHPYAPKFIFPKFPIEWMSIKCIWKWSKWDVMYVLFEAFQWIVCGYIVAIT